MHKIQHEKELWELNKKTILSESDNRSKSAQKVFKKS